MNRTNVPPNDETLVGLASRRLQKVVVTPELKEKTVQAVLDYIGAIASGLKAPWASQAIRYAESQQANGEAHAWGLQKNVSAKTAAYVNALLAHSAIRDDMHLKSNSHIGSIVISAALSLAQRDKWTGEQLIRGIIGGYEAASLLGTAVQQSPGYNRHMRPSGICGAFGAAGAGIAATNVPTEVAVNALAFAANMSSGFCEWAWAGGVEIYTEMGSASQAGIDALDLAKAGLECSETILEGRAGLFAAFDASRGPDIFRERLNTNVGTGIMDVRFKPVPGCNYAQTPLAVALKLAKNYDLSQGIQSIRVDCTSGAKRYPGCDNPGPFSNVQQTKMSIQFGVTAVLLNASVSEEVFAMFTSQHITVLASACSVEAADEFEQSFQEGRQPARVKVGLNDGTTVVEELTDVPWLDATAVRARFLDETKDLLGLEQSQLLAVGVENLLETDDLSSLWKLFKRA